MKILIADKLSPLAIDHLKSLGLEVDCQPDLTADDLTSSLSDADILIVRSTKVQASAIASANKLSLIIRAGAGTNTIDLEAASMRGIYVSNCPGKNTEAVAELALGLLIAADRHIVSANRDLIEGKWRKKEYGKARGLKGQRLGILGYGSIGRALAQRARALEMEIMVWSRSLTKETAKEENILFAQTPLEIAQNCDAISLHLAAAAETKHLVNEQFLSLMKEGSILINTARGDVIDTQALRQALKTKKLHVGLDVYENEPSGGEADFSQKDLALEATCTPHIGASTKQAAEAIALEAVCIVKNFIETGTPPNVVNIRSAKAERTLVIKHLNQVGVLASILQGIRQEQINVEEVVNTIFKGDAVASCIFVLSKEPSQKFLEKLKTRQEILQITLK